MNLSPKTTRWILIGGIQRVCLNLHNFVQTGIRVQDT